jgi:hypothetical protein
MLMNALSSREAGAFADKGARCRLTDLILRPLFVFLRCLVLKRQIFRGTTGITFSVLSAYEEFIKHLKLWELNNVLHSGAE